MDSDGLDSHCSCDGVGIGLVCREEEVIMWRDIETAPKDDTEILILFDSATVEVVRLCWWNDGVGCDFEPEPESKGWWSYQNSVTQELMSEDLMKVIGWMPMPQARYDDKGRKG